MTNLLELLGRLERASMKYQKRNGVRAAKHMRFRFWKWWERQTWIPPLLEPELVAPRRTKT